MTVPDHREIAKGTLRAILLGGTGGGIAYNWEEFDRIAESGLNLSMNSEILIEESLEGWKEYELEVMRDCKDNVVIVCSIENLDPMGIHTGDSITVADKDEVMLITQQGQLIRSPIKEIRTTGRAAQGVRLIRLAAKDSLASVATVVPEEEVEEESGALPPKE